MDEEKGKPLSEEVSSTKAGAILLIVSSIIILVVFVWHALAGGAALSGTALAEAMVASRYWAEMHLLGSFGFALLASASFVLTHTRGAFGTGALTRASFSLLFVGSLLASVGFVVDGQRAFIAPDVVRGENLALFNALTLLWDDRGLAVLSFVILGVGIAILALAQLRTPTVSPRWASLVALIGALMIAVVGLFVFELRIFSFQILGIGLFPALVWLISVGALALKRSSSATAEEHSQPTKKTA